MAFQTVVSRRIRSRRKAEVSMARHIFLGVLLMIGIGTLLTGVWYLTRLPAVTITQIQIEGGETIPHDQIRTTVETILADSYFLLVPHRFSYTYPEDAIVKAVGALPRVHNVRIDRTNRQSMHIVFDEYVPYALLCPTRESTRCYFLDSTGYAFAQAPNLTGGALIRHVREDVPDLAVGDTFPLEEFVALNSFIGRLRDELSLRISDVVYTEDGDRELFIHGGGSLKITKEREQGDTIAYLASIFASKEFKHLEPGNFNYIDLRFGKKIFVNEELPSEIVSTTTATTTALESATTE